MRHESNLFNTHYFCIVDSDDSQQYTQNELLSFHCNNGYVDAPQYYVVLILSVL